ncbi:hypothetical protein Kpol_538p20 [Vanderwaltozyma polyspora DSM 70294]|uniref:Protein kinase domain-containing protein n=1 Tax=Vanderwaltozyma polyspora (strain ATCC 22028 / DSM 70294 / BCRC 21397 / CBS 2163 / NBRC 10782 / NRRL Y-8283 / UCD 57-17) TaxID=436907 RepID=A7TKD3_VANPO|nr:uncharacterized protein Kpol_538p20 [Vanderwaltozyma polyspora DSM 70294]EDO17260.1 hypothetical protein Kpol_538p20 [Vanderwaltozyma polyspora DSM 70294]
MNGSVTRFEEIESEKENILPLKYGRSAAQLSHSLQQDVSELSSVKISFERRLIDDLEEMDDPLELFLKYIDWINNAYPQGGNSKQSGMLDIMERCLLYFKDVETYRNDPRYLKIWLWYIELFSSDSIIETKDILVYMYRNRIAQKLALFYEQFSIIMFNMHKYKESHYILSLGVKENARPHTRITRKLQDLENKLVEMNIDINNRDLEYNYNENEPNSRGVPLFLQSFNPPRMVLGREVSNIPHVSVRHDQVENDIQQSSKQGKLHIFKDTDNSKNDEIDGLRKDGWNILESKHIRDKENKATSDLLEPGVNIGKIYQDRNSTLIRKDEKKITEKLPIFQDKLGRPEPTYKIIEIPGRKTEKIDCNFNLIYPNTHEEYSLEEILALSKNIYHKIQKPKTSIPSNDDEHIRKKMKTSIPLSNKKIEFPPTQPPLEPGSTSPSTLDQNINNGHINKSLTLEYKNHTRTSILPLNDVPISDETEVPNTAAKAPNSPTVTFFSKDAMNEVYSMFNQHYQEPNEGAENEDTTSKFAFFENFTEEFTRQNIDDLTEVKNNLPQLDKTPNRETNVSSEIENIDASKQQLTTTYKSKLKEYMTPIKEKNENSIRTINSTQSSPFLTQPQPLISNIINNPLDEKFRTELLGLVSPPLDTYSTFYRYNQSLKMSTLLKKIHKVSISENKNPIVDFKKTGDLYCIRAELGEGGYATVYLAESSTGKLKALKVEKPASVWEYYILKQVEFRLQNRDILRSIINVNSLHCFLDESYLVLNYANQGTLLDLINYYKNSRGTGIDEILCMFITVELIKIITSIHSVGIIHGDLKPDNCMIRFEKGKINSYQASGDNGWYRKGIYLIDFGRSFDMTILPENTKFVANWETDNQDCPQMRKGECWSYEADYYGLASIIFCMLFGKTIEISRDGALRCSMKRYWRGEEIWNPLFSLLIQGNKVDNVNNIEQQLQDIRKRIEDVLTEEHSDRLKSLIYDLENELCTRNMKI